MKKRILFCQVCGWSSEEGVGMKPICPDCETHLSLLSGTTNEVDEYVARKRANIKKGLVKK